VVLEAPRADWRPRRPRDYERQAEAKGLHYVYVPTALVVRSDPALLERILRNFLSNAVRYTSSGRIIVGCRRSGGQVRLEVWDSGIGIPRSQQKTIFREFYQLGNPERDRNKGLGLGLAIVERLSRLLDHPVAVRSALGRYACLSVTVPRGDATRVAPPSPRLAPDLTALSGQLVVVIDDESLVRAGMSELLTGWGCEVIAAPSAEAALAGLQQRDAVPDVIIADYRLRGGRTGADAVRDVVAVCGRPVPSLIITGDTSAERLHEVQASGLQLLHKPVQPAQLRTFLMRLKRARDASGSGYLTG
jgi:CheY-like chemotaxis protein